MKLVVRLLSRITRQGIGKALQHKHYRIYVFTNFSSTVGMWLQRVGVGWLAWEMTHSGFWLGAVAVAEAVPTITLLAIAGAVTDRVDRLKLMKATQFAALNLGLLLAGLTYFEWLDIYLLVAVVFVIGLVNTFALSVRMTLAPSLVPRKDLTAAISLHSALFNSARFVGPACAGLIIDYANVTVAFVITALGYLVFFIGLGRIRLRRHEHDTRGSSGLLADVMESFRYVKRHVGIGPLLLLLVIASVFTRSIMDLFPGIADEVFQQGAQGLGYLYSAVGIGGIVGGLWLAHKGQTRGLIRIFLSTLFITCVAQAIFSFITNFSMALIIVVVLGFTLSVTQNAAQIVIQNAVEGSMRGRVMSLYGLTFRAGPSVGALVIGSISTQTGLSLPIAAAAMIALIALVFLSRPLMARHASLESPAQHS